MDKNLCSTILAKAVKLVADCDILRDFEFEIGLKSLNCFPNSGMLNQLELSLLSDIASVCLLHYYVSIHKDSICFVMYVPNLILTSDNLVLRHE